MKLTYKKILIVCSIMGIALLAHDYLDARVNFDGQLTRNEAGKGNSTEDLDLSFSDESRQISVEVSEKGLSEDEIEAYFKQAIKEIDATYLGKNKSPNKVTYDLDLKTSYCDGLVSAYWKFDNYGLISSDGVLNVENIPEEGQLVSITVELVYEGESQLYSFSVVLYQLGTETTEGKINAINRALSKIDKDTRNKDTLSLPKSVENISLTWKKRMNFRGLQIILLGVAAVIGLQVGEKRDEKLNRKKQIEEKEQDYPMIVSELSILLSAGMSFRKALERIIIKYNYKKKNGISRPGYEDMICTYRKMMDGMGEIAALEDMGQKSESKEYRKLAMLLVQNLRKGSKDLIATLEKEEQYAFEMRKQRAIRAGEEASTKLLLPMAGMLFIVIVILIVPALMQLG